MARDGGAGPPRGDGVFRRAIDPVGARANHSTGGQEVILQRRSMSRVRRGISRRGRGSSASQKASPSGSRMRPDTALRATSEPLRQLLQLGHRVAGDAGGIEAGVHVVEQSHAQGIAHVRGPPRSRSPRRARLRPRAMRGRTSRRSPRPGRPRRPPRSRPACSRADPRARDRSRNAGSARSPRRSARRNGGRERCRRHPRPRPRRHPSRGVRRRRLPTSSREPRAWEVDRGMMVGASAGRQRLPVRGDGRRFAEGAEKERGGRREEGGLMGHGGWPCHRAVIRADDFGSFSRSGCHGQLACRGPAIRCASASPSAPPARPADPAPPLMNRPDDLAAFCPCLRPTSRAPAGELSVRRGRGGRKPLMHANRLNLRGSGRTRPSRTRGDGRIMRGTSHLARQPASPASPAVIACESSWISSRGPARGDRSSSTATTRSSWGGRGSSIARCPRTRRCRATTS